MQIGWNCIYHPVMDMRVVDDAMYEDLIASGVWFKHPNEAKEMRAKYEQRLHNEKRKGRSDRSKKTLDGGVSA